METTIHKAVTVLPGHRLELTDPQLPEGARVEVTVVVRQMPRQRISMLELVDSLPPGPRAFPTWDEYERHLREEKEAWDR